jgi:hypothetical protein
MTATTDQEHRITLDWDTVPGATRYYVYRSPESTEPFTTAHADGGVPHATTNTSGFVDSSLDVGVYNYQVTAVQMHTGVESAPSATATGRSIDGPNEWQPAVALGDSKTVRTATDRSAVGSRPFVLTVPNETGAQVRVRRLEFDGSLTQFGTAFGQVDGTVARVADLAVVDGELLVAIVRDPGTDGAAPTVELWRWRDDHDEFRRVATLPTAAFATASPLLSMAAQSTDRFTLAYRGAAGEMVIYSFASDGSGTEIASPPAATNDSTEILTQMEIAASDSMIALAYEVEDGSGATTALEAATVSAPAWDWSSPTTGDLLSVESGAPDPPFPPEGPVHALAVAVDPAPGGYGYVGFVANNGIYIADPALDAGNPLHGNALVSDDPGFAGDALLSARANVGIAASEGRVRVFHLDADEAGEIRVADEAGASWSIESPDGFTTGTDPTPLHIVTPGDRIYATYRSTTIFGGRSAYIRAFQ